MQRYQPSNAAIPNSRLRTPKNLDFSLDYAVGQARNPLTSFPFARKIMSVSWNLELLLAMCMAFFSNSDPQVKQLLASPGQMEDNLYQYALKHGLDRTDPYALAKILQNYGLKDRFTKSASIEEVKAWLAAQKPAITHGYFTGFGHIIVLVGYDEAGFIVHDPYGEWYATGCDRNDPYGNNIKGKYQHYSYDLIKRKCIPDGHFWVHFVSAP